ncbi:hypothetical protein B4N89_27730 [Embleya scabrispora]|uniref:DUF4082 domain-containing protein n=1 Tax=Embleya scabrispora TaxID=159449 RepID=A0A1T3P582_9ACTN|nr:DUF4082 domain-containing protein [Embleya scabrispora]OPC84214.1 hypothetical protein B4N89_27730 [Embleya scabrispora]
MTDFRIWPNTDGRTESSTEETPVSLGTEFVLSATGWAKALHYWRATEAELGTVTGAIYAVDTDAEIDGTAVTFVVSGVGWQTYTLAAPVRLEADTRYVVSVHHPNRYAMGLGAYFSAGPGAAGITNGIITAPPTSAVTSPNGQGRYEYGPTRVAPRQTFNANAYLSDVTVGDTDPGGTVLTPVGIPGTATVGTPTLTPDPVTLTPQGIDGTSTVGLPTLAPRPVTLAPQGIASGAIIGEPTLTATATLTPQGIGSTSTVGTPGLTPGTVVLRPVGIPSTARVGEPVIRLPGDHSHDISLGALTDPWTLGALA